MECEALTIVMTFVGGIAGYAIQEMRHKREMAAKMIELATLTLFQPVSKEREALRDWAVNVLARYAAELEAPLSAPAQAALKGEPFYADGTFAAAASAVVRARSK